MKKCYILLPGWGFSSQVFSSLNRDCFLHRYVDLPMEFKSQEDMIYQLAKKIPNESDVIAWSLSGVLSLMILELFPNKINSLVITSSTPYFSSNNTWHGVSEKSKQKLYNTFQNKGPIEFRDYFLDLICFRETSFLSRKYLAKFCKFESKYMKSNAIYLELLFNKDMRIISHQYKHRITYILGSRDYIIPLQTAKQLSLHNKVRIINGAGHCPFISHKDDFLDIIREKHDWG